MAEKRNPWLRLTRLIFGERRPFDDPEIKALEHQIDAGFKKTGHRCVNTRDREREILVAESTRDREFGDRLLNGTLDEDFLRKCIDLMNSKGFSGSYGGPWTVNGMRQLIKELRSPRPKPRPLGPTAWELENDEGDPPY